MDKNRTEGAMDKAMASVKSGVGEVTGDDKMMADGAADKAKGKAESAVGGVKDALKGKS